MQVNAGQHLVRHGIMGERGRDARMYGHGHPVPEKDAGQAHGDLPWSPPTMDLVDEHGTIEGDEFRTFAGARSYFRRICRSGIALHRAIMQHHGRRLAAWGRESATPQLRRLDDGGSFRSTAPSASKACRWASVTPVSPVMSTPSYRRSGRSARLRDPVLVSQRRTTPSRPPLATSRPSPLSATPQTPPTCPWRVASNRSPAGSQSRTVPSKPALAISRPSSFSDT